MAIFYEHIKGLSTNSDDITNSAFQYIKWQKVYNQTDEGMLPQFYNNATSYGHLIVSGNSTNSFEQTFYNSLILEYNAATLKFSNGQGTPTYWKIYNNNTNHLTFQYGTNAAMADFSPNGVKLQKQTTTNNTTTSQYLDLGTGANSDIVLENTAGAGGITLKSDHISLTSSYFDTNGFFRTYKHIYVGSGSAESESIGSIHAENYIKSNTYIQANYFNATSDQRLKTNINPLPSTLDFVCKTPLYSFTYTTNNLPSIGVVAQDIQDAQFGNFKPVVTPRNEKDFLSVHESKFVYILWKAIQEQQEEIEALKAEIAELKKTEN